MLKQKPVIKSEMLPLTGSATTGSSTITGANLMSDTSPTFASLPACHLQTNHKIAIGFL